jgi:hypothetical protein
MLQGIAVAVVAMGLYFGAKEAVKGVKKADHAVCRVVTFGEKCKPKK